jgi:hypothetical protein
MNKNKYIFFFALLIIACSKSDNNDAGLKYLNFNEISIEQTKESSPRGISLTPTIAISFSEPVDRNSIEQSISITRMGVENTKFESTLSNGDSVINISFTNALAHLTKYNLTVNQTLKSKRNRILFSEINYDFTTQFDPAHKFPSITDDALLTKVQEQTFKFFWDFGHPVSGMARERNTSGDLVTSGGTGFGIMSIIVGIERGFITKMQGLERITLITDFLLNKADRFHGVFPHWLSGTTGKVIPFSSKDDGGDLVETSFLIAGLLSASEYFAGSNSAEVNLRKKINTIWVTVEWNWNTKQNENVLYWHWSPKYNWEMNHQIKGWNESLITYVLAAASPTHSISKDVYTKGWASDGNMKNGKSFYGIMLPLGPDLGGPLFFEHYSFLGLNPQKLKDQYADYWQQAVNHSKINYEYVKANPLNYYGYSKDSWGLTASDTKGGYTAHSPTNDKGVISPTAALSSMPYTPKESMDALRFFYYVLGDRIFKQYGFTDAFSLHHIWFADSFLAIDQGPIIIMIENHRTGLMWNLLMKNKDLKLGLDKLGFTY